MTKIFKSGKFTKVAKTALAILLTVSVIYFTPSAFAQDSDESISIVGQKLIVNNDTKEATISLASVALENDHDGKYAIEGPVYLLSATDLDGNPMKTDGIKIDEDLNLKAVKEGTYKFGIKINSTIDEEVITKVVNFDIKVEFKNDEPTDIADSKLDVDGTAPTSLFSGYSAMTVLDSSLPSELVLSKTASENNTTDVSQSIYRWDISLSLKGKDVSKTSDVVLVLDVSGSMNDNSRLANMKAAAKAFVNNLLADNSTTRIAIVSFSEYGVVQSDFSTSASNLNRKINDLTAVGGTNIHDGLSQANSLLSNSSAHKKNIVILGDGKPTYSYRISSATGITANSFGNYNFESNYTMEFGERIGDGLANQYSWHSIDGKRSLYLDGPNGKHWFPSDHSYSTDFIATEAKRDGIEIYSIAFDVEAADGDAFGKEVLQKLASSSNNYYSLNSSNISSLISVFTKIANSISYAATGALISDPMGDVFDLVNTKTGTIINTKPLFTAAIDAGEVYVTKNGVKLGVNEVKAALSYDPATDRITWNAGDVRQIDNEIVLHYTVQIRVGDGTNNTAISGIEYPTNKQTTVEYTDSNGNETSKDFDPIPEVGYTTSSHIVKYEWTGLPTDSAVYNAIGVNIAKPIVPTGENVEHGGSHIVSTDKYSDLYTKDVNGNLKEKYVFQNDWTPNGTNGVITNISDDITIRGTWVKETAKYLVYYQWTGLPTDAKVYNADGSDLIKPIKPASVTVEYGGSHVVSTVKYPDVYTKVDGNINSKCVFNNDWNPKGTITNIVENKTIIGSWECGPIEYNVNYQWTGLPTDAKVYDANGNEINKPQVPDTSTVEYGDTHTVSTDKYPEVYTKDASGNINAKYVFNDNWSPNGTLTIVKDETINGSWTKVPYKYEITYEWDGLPEEPLYDKDGKPTIPSVPGPYDVEYGGSHTTSTDKYPDVYTKVDGNNTSKCVFNEDWASTSDLTNITDDVTITGSWECSPVSYEVTYKYEGEVPTDATTLLPKGHNVAFGSSVTVANDVTSESKTHDGKSGEWTFNGWKTSDVTVAGGKFTMPAKDVTIVGTWTFTQTYTVKYVDENGTTVILNESGLKTGNNIPVPSTNPTKASDEEYTYEFKGWEIVSGTEGQDGKVGETDLEYKATYEESAKSYEVTYKYEGAVPTDASTLLPQSHNAEFGSSVTVANNVTSESKTHDGKSGEWTFNGWKTSDVTVAGGKFDMPAKDVTIVGTWTFTEDSKYGVTYSNALKTTDGADIDVSVLTVLDRYLPTDSKMYYVDGDVVVKPLTEIEYFDQATHKTYTFEGYKIDTAIVQPENTVSMIDGGLKFIAQWSVEEEAKQNVRVVHIKEELMKDEINGRYTYFNFLRDEGQVLQLDKIYESDTTIKLSDFASHTNKLKQDGVLDGYIFDRYLPEGNTQTEGGELQFPISKMMPLHEDDNGNKVLYVIYVLDENENEIPDMYEFAFEYIAGNGGTVTCITNEKDTIEYHERLDVDGNRTYVIADTVAVNPIANILVEANDGYKFSHWECGDDEYADLDAIRAEEFNDDKVFVAVFEKLPTDVPNPTPTSTPTPTTTPPTVTPTPTPPGRVTPTPTPTPEVPTPTSSPLPSPTSTPESIQIDEDETPEAVGIGCWIHWLMLLVTLVYSLYSGIRVNTRKKDNEELEDELYELKVIEEGAE